MVSASADLRIEYLTISGGSAEEGGAVYVERASLTVLGSVFESNTATDSGGAIDVE